MTHRKPPPPPPPGDGKKAKKPDAFEIWLHRGLHQLYDNVAQEPIPSELLRLIEEDRSK